MAHIRANRLLILEIEWMTEKKDSTMAYTPVPAMPLESAAQGKEVSVPLAWVWSQYRGQFDWANQEAFAQSASRENGTTSLGKESACAALASDPARSIAVNIKNIVKKNEEKKRSQRKSWPKPFGGGAMVALGSAMALVGVVFSQMQYESRKQISLQNEKSLSAPIAFNDVSISKQKLASSFINQQSAVATAVENTQKETHDANIAVNPTEISLGAQQQAQNSAFISPEARPDQGQGAQASRATSEVSKGETATDFIHTTILKLQEPNKYGALPETQAVVQSLTKLLAQDKLASKQISYTDTTGSISKSKKAFMHSELSLFSIPLIVLLLSMGLYFQSRRDKMGLDALRLNNVEFDQILRGIENSVTNFNVTDDEILKQRQTARALIQKHTRKDGILSWLGLQ